MQRSNCGFERNDKAASVLDQLSFVMHGFAAFQSCFHHCNLELRNYFSCKKKKMQGHIKVMSLFSRIHH